jgi:hypothetical protein
LRVLRLEVSINNVYITNQFQTPLLLKGGGGGNPLAEMTVKSKEENSEDFCPNYVQEFGLCTLFLWFFPVSNPGLLLE